MRRQLTSLALMVCGALVMALSMTIGPAPTPAAASPALQPSPRPTLQPTPNFVTATPAPVDEPPGNESVPTPLPQGRVTGTVIDLRTNAPAPNKLVTVGGVNVLSDANGNYERWVDTGYYSLALDLRGGEGTPIQGPQEVAVGPGDTVVVHLFFTSPAPVVLPAPTAPVAAAEPPAVLPPSLPDTSREPAAPAARPAAAPARAPESLPDTATPTPLQLDGLWLLGGALLLAFGLSLQFIPRRRRAAQRAMLAEMLAQAPRRSPEQTLRDLLDRDL